MFDHIEAFYRPSSVPEALRLLQKNKGKSRIVAGGTDLVLAGDRSVRCLIDITHAGLGYIRKQGRGLTIGATAALADLEASPLVRDFAGGMLARSAATCGSIQNRNMATVGGNLVNASPAADMAVPLLALDATVTMAGARGAKSYPLAEYLASAHNAAFAQSILTEVIVPPVTPKSAWCFQKLGRTNVDISLVNLAAGIEIDGKGRVKWVRLALGAVAPTPVRAVEAESLMAGREFNRCLIEDAAACVRGLVHPITDVRATAEYRCQMSGVLVACALEACAAQLGCSL